MIKINIISNNTAWFRYLKNPFDFIKKRNRKINKKFKKHKKNIIHCTLLLSGDKEIKELNKKFRKKNKTTDVLSFPFYNYEDLKLRLKKEKEIYLGDIIVNLNKIKNKKNNFESEFNKLWVHGLVHLFGHDHQNDKDFYRMKRVEKKFLEYLG